MSRPVKRGITDDESVTSAEEELHLTYPLFLREKLKQQNGFQWGSYRFYCVYDSLDKFNTYDDVVRENHNSVSGWGKFLPAGYAAIADDQSGWCLALAPRDSKIYEYNGDTGAVEVFANDEQTLTRKLDEMET